MFDDSYGLSEVCDNNWLRETRPFSPSGEKVAERPVYKVALV
jgi:hypothetical protein